MKPLADVAVEGLLCSTMDKRCLLLHMMVASDVAGIPESEELLSVKRDSKAAMPCHMCEIKEKDA